LLTAAFSALLIISYDYTYGHVDEDVFKPEWCPLCHTFQSAECVDVLVGFFIVLIFSITLNHLLPSAGFAKTVIYLSHYPHRAPPATA
jgi:hypothetical protein